MSVANKFVRNKGNNGNRYHVPMGSKDRQVGVRISAKMLQEIEELIWHPSQLKLFGWKTVGDFYRFAIRNALDHCVPQLQDKKLMSRRQQENAFALLLAQEQELQSYRDTFEKAEKNSREMMAEGLNDVAQEHIELVWDAVRSMPEGKLRKHYVKRFLERFGGMIKRIQISFLAKDMEKDENPEETQRLNDIVEAANEELRAS